MNRFVICDAAKCIGCRACEVSCVMAHNQNTHVSDAEEFQPRINVVHANNFNTALLCRHCDDAPCVNSCPEGAIVYRNNSVQVIQEKCIGCKSCEVACPFGVMTVTVEEKNGELISANALKCDLCEGREAGPACVENCPSDALSLVTEETLAMQRKYKQSRTAMGGLPNTVANIASKTKGLGKITRLRKSQQRRDPVKVDSSIRRANFFEIYPTFTEKEATDASGRCLTCGTHSVCEWSCPLHNRIPDLIKLTNEGDIMRAVELSHQTNSLPEITGRVCPQDSLCESACTLKEDFGAVTIGNLERFITDTAFEKGWKPDLSYVKQTDKKVAIIGGGPAGLACADILVRNGVKPVIFERQPEIGGMLTFGIPSFKLDKNILIHRRELFTEMGVEFHLNCEVECDVHFDRLIEEYDAIFLGVGAYNYVQAGLENENSSGVYDALPYLNASTKDLMNWSQWESEPYINLKDKKVVVLGGGDTAMDCSRTAIRQGAEKVTCAYRRDEANMPGSKKEVVNAKEEGVDFEFMVQPIRIEVDDQDRVIGIRLLRTEMGEADASGRRRPQPIPGSEFVMAADAVIVAFGFNAHSMPWLNSHDIEFNSKDCVIAERNASYPFQTTSPKIFAGGDVVRGADLVVYAIDEGRQAAQGMMDYMGVETQRPIDSSLAPTMQ